jgi:hypothetical protein
MFINFLFFQASKDYVIGQILDALDELISTVENKSICDDEEEDSIGSFVALVDTVRYDYHI